MVNQKHSRWQRYGVAVLAVAIALLLQLLLDPLLEIESPFLLFFAAVMVSAWYGGMRPGVLATVLAALSSDYFFLSPTASFVFNSLGQNARLVVFGLEGVAISRLVAQLQTVKQQAEVNHSQLQASQAQVRRLIDANLIGIFAADLKGNITEANDAFLEMVGYTRAELLSGKVRWDVMTPPEYRATDQQAIEELRKTGVGRAYEKEYIRKDGSRIPILLGSALYEGSQELGVGFVIDLSDRKQTEQALQQALQKLTFLVENSPLAVVEWNRDYRVSRWSDQAEAIFGWKAEEVLGKKPTDWQFVYPEDLEEVEAVIRRLVDGSEQRNVVCNRNYCKDGSLVHCEWYSSALLDDSGKLISVLCLVLDVTQRQQLAAALQQKAIEQEALLNSIPALVYYKDRHSNYLAANQTLAEFTNTPLAQIPGKTDFDLLSHNEALALRQDDQEVITSGQPKLNIEETITGTDGKIMWMATNKTPYRDRQGEITGLVGISIDITNRKRVEKALQQSEERYRSLVVATSQIVWTTNAEGQVVDIPSWRAYTGQSQEETKGWGWLETLHPEDRDRTAQVWLEAVQTKSLYQTEYRVRGADGNYRYFLTRGVPVIAEDGKIREWVGTCTDITDRQQAEEQIRLHTIRLQALAEASRTFSEGILEFPVLLDTITQQIAQMLGDICVLRLLSEDRQFFELVSVYHPNPEVGALIRETLAAAPQAVNEGLAGHVMLTGQPLLLPVVSQEQLRASAQASYLPYLEGFGVHSILIVPLRVRERLIGTLHLSRDRPKNSYTAEDLLFVQDLAERAALAIDNAHLYRQALEANRLKDDFLAIVSHELRTPMNVVLNWTTLLRTRQFNEDKKVQALEIIERNAKLQTQLIEDLLDISRLMRGQLRLNLRPLNLAPVLEAAIKSILPLAEAKAIQLISVFAPAVSLVNADPDRLQQVMWNLLSNAIKFTSPGGKVEVRLSVCHDPLSIASYAQIEVIDTGKGISPEFLPHVFDRFRQAERAMTRSSSGLGLGLAIVRQFVELHGGTVEVDSPGVGQGATFTVKLPLWETIESEEILG